MKPLDPLALLETLVAIRSVNPFETVLHEGKELGVGCESEIQNYLETLLQNLGFTTTRQIVQKAITVECEGQKRTLPERWNVLAEKGEGNKSLLMFGHTDTVDVKDGWKTDPFTLTRDTFQGRTIFRGLGSNDMKGGVASMLAGISAIDEVPAGWKIKVALLVDEEFWSYGAVKLLESSFVDDVAVALVPEIADAGLDPTAQWLGLGRLGRAEFVFDVYGHACHGSDALVHPDAVNAVHEAVHLESEIIRYSKETKQTFRAGGISVANSAYINQHQGGKGVLSVPDHASFIFDRTLVPGESLEEEQRKLESLVLQAKEKGVIDPRCRVQISYRPRPTPPCKPYFIEEDSDVAKFIASIAERVCGKYQFGIGRSVADENRFVERGIPTIIIAPNGHGYHTCDEWVDEESLYRSAKVFQFAIQGLNTLE